MKKGDSSVPLGLEFDQAVSKEGLRGKGFPAIYKSSVSVATEGNGLTDLCPVQTSEGTFFLSCFGFKACGILGPQAGIKPVSPALEAWSLNHWTTTEVPASNIFKFPLQCSAWH